MALSSLLGFHLLGNTRYRLENDAMCGIPTGGKGECYFDCDLIASASLNTFDFEADYYGLIGIPKNTVGQLIPNLTCLSDCFPPEHGVSLLIQDVLRDGTCFPLKDNNGKNIFKVADFCDSIYDGTYDSAPFGDTVIERGTCSGKTEELLDKESTLREVFEQPGFIINTIRLLIFYSCKWWVSYGYFKFIDSIPNFYDAIYYRSGDDDDDDSDLDVDHVDIDVDPSISSTHRSSRLLPLPFVLEFPDQTVHTKVNTENTLNRYPWACSLRTKSVVPRHLCAVTLLSIPPKPTVIVGAAHCTYLCKKENEVTISSCCCATGPENCSENKAKCGESPKVYLMTPQDADILCMEWETGAAPSDLSGEKKNILLEIIEIVRHPKFNPEQGGGPLAGNDLAVFKVEDSNIQGNRARQLKLWPACLPLQKSKSKTGIHTGWSRPPPFPFVDTYVNGYIKFYRDFFKQWHYKMDIQEKCEDPIVDGITGQPLKYPSNTSYPAGAVCAKDFSRQSCFSNGDSGSPLMVREESRPMRFVAEGILSFVKGCDVFTFGNLQLARKADSEGKYQLNQQSENPAVYTKLSCFLPWIASQYNMEYESNTELDQACLQGSGDPYDGEEKTCTSTPSTLKEGIAAGEAECIFPFFYKGKKYNECVQFDELDFAFPVFRCPTRNITRKIDNINSFTFADVGLTGGYCISRETGSALDPSIACCDYCYYIFGKPCLEWDTCDPKFWWINDDYNRRRPFSQCKNNCPGVRPFGIIGSGAVLGFTTGASVLSTLVPLVGAGVIGAIGIGGSMVAQAMCFTPFCRALQGQCCVLVVESNGVVCPDTC